jgi:hypothetical protein
MQHRPDLDFNPTIAKPFITASCFMNESCSEYAPAEGVSRATKSGSKPFRRSQFPESGLNAR